MAWGLDKLSFHWTFPIARMRKARMYDNTFQVSEFEGKLGFLLFLASLTPAPCCMIRLLNINQLQVLSCFI